MHCPTCTCAPKYGYSLTVYPANEILYGRCEACGQVRWSAELSFWTQQDGWMPVASRHCGCCVHPHDLAPGGHEFTLRQWKARANLSRVLTGGDEVPSLADAVRRRTEREQQEGTDAAR